MDLYSNIPNSIDNMTKRCLSLKRTTHPWSKLQSALYRVVAKETDFQIHCCAYNTGLCIPFPRYWITIGKDIVWDFPENAMCDTSDWYFYDEAKGISRLIKAYVDCPRNDLFSFPFYDRWKMLPFLQACDRRIGKRRLKKMLEKEEYSCVDWIIQKRLECIHSIK